MATVNMNGNDLYLDAGIGAAYDLTKTGNPSNFALGVNLTGVRTINGRGGRQVTIRGDVSADENGTLTLQRKGFWSTHRDGFRNPGAGLCLKFEGVVSGYKQIGIISGNQNTPSDTDVKMYGESLYANPFMLFAGELEVGSEGLTFDIPLNSVSDSAIQRGWIEIAGSLTVDDNLSGNITKEGAGELLLSGNMTEYTGEISVEEGQLTLNPSGIGQGALSVKMGEGTTLVLGSRTRVLEFGSLSLTFEEEAKLEMQGSVILNGGTITSESQDGLSWEVPENKMLTLRNIEKVSSINFVVKDGGTLNLGGSVLGEGRIEVQPGGFISGIGGNLTLADGSFLQVEAENLYGEENSSSVLQYEGATEGPFKLEASENEEGEKGEIVLEMGESLTEQSEGKFNMDVWLANAAVEADASVLKVSTQSGGYLYYAEMETLEGADGEKNTVLHIHGSDDGVWKASVHGDISSFSWQDPSWTDGADDEWKIVYVDKEMKVNLSPDEGNDSLQLNLLTGTSEENALSFNSGSEVTILLNNDSEIISGTIMSVNTEMQGDIVVEDKSETVNFEKTGDGVLTVSGNFVAGKSELSVKGGTIRLVGDGNKLGAIGEFGSNGEMRLDGTLALEGDATLQGEGILSGGGRLKIAADKVLTVDGEFQGGKSKILLDLSNKGSKFVIEGGEHEAQFGALLGKEDSTVDCDGNLVLVGVGAAEPVEYSGKLEGGGTITVRDGGKQRFISWDEKKSSRVSLVSGRNGEVHLRGGSSPGSGVTQYKDITVQTDKDAYGHEAYGKLYVECEDGRNSSIRVSGDITLEKGTTIYLQFDTSNGLGSKGSNDRTDSSAQALLRAGGKIRVDNLVKFVITLEGDSRGFNPEEELNLVLMEGGGYGDDGNSYKADSTLYGGDLTLDPLLKVYYENVQVEFRSDHQVVLTGDMRTESPLEGVAGTANSKAGADLLWERRGDADLRDRESALYKVYTGIMEMGEKNPRGASKALAAVAGSSAAALGSAQRDAMRGQIGRMRDRASQLGLAGGYSYDSLPYWHAWVEGEGAYNKLSEDGDESGYRLSSWGGSFGVDADLTERTAFGMAVTAMHGDLKTSGADAGSGDLDSYYVSAMLRIQRRRSAHTVVASIGADDAKLERQVNYGTGSYRSSGSTSGESFGALYEYTYDMPGNARGTALLQPLVTASVMHGSIKDYDESGADALPLHVDKQDWTTATVGVGLRWMCTIGENVLNRSAIFEARGAVMQDIGDTQGKVRVGLLKAPEVLRDVESAEVGSTAVQLSVGLRAPVSEQAQVFFNAGTELRSGMTSWNLAAGLRYDF